MYYYFYNNSKNEIIEALDELNIDYITKENNSQKFKNHYDTFATINFNKNNEKKLIDYFNKKNYDIVFLIFGGRRSVWIKQLEDVDKIKCFNCKNVVNDYNTPYISCSIKCINCIDVY